MLPLRKIAIAGALVATVAASFLDLPGANDDAPSQAGSAPKPRAQALALAPNVRQMQAQTPTEAPENASAQAPLRAPFEAPVVNLFAPHHWQPPVLSAAQALPPSAPPSAPPLPFRYLGKTMDQGAITVFVSHGASTLVLHGGDVLADYRVDSITPSEMTLVYLPLNEPQRLIFGSAN